MSHLVQRTILPLIEPNASRSAILDKPITEHCAVKIDPYLPAVKKINEQPSVTKKEILDPSLPGGLIEKRCVGWNMLVVRRKKMKKHQRKKRRKRLKYLFLKRSLRRTAMKEIAFQNEILTKLKEAEKFDPVEYVQSKLDIVNKKIPPYRLRGVIMPTWVIEEEFQKTKQIIELIEDKKRRRKEMLAERGTLKCE